MIENEGLCPAVSTLIKSEPHAVVIDKFVNVDDAGDEYYICKNTNKNNTKVLVGYSTDDDVYPLYEAILIQFHR